MEIRKVKYEERKETEQRGKENSKDAYINHKGEGKTRRGIQMREGRRRRRRRRGRSNRKEIKSMEERGRRE